MSSSTGFIELYENIPIKIVNNTKTRLFFTTSSTSFSPFFEYLVIISTTSLPNTTDPINTSIENCLREENIKQHNPPAKNKSDNFIFVFVNVRIDSKITNVQIASVLFINVSG